MPRKGTPALGAVRTLSPSVHGLAQSAPFASSYTVRCWRAFGPSSRALEKRAEGTLIGRRLSLRRVIVVKVLVDDGGADQIGVTQSVELAYELS